MMSENPVSSSLPKLPPLPLFVVGLGNVGNKYLLNRHNVGFMLLDCLAHTLEHTQGRTIGSSTWQQKQHFLYYSSTLTRSDTSSRIKITLIKPTTLMNRSHLAVMSLMQQHKIPPSSILVAHDDLDLSLSVLKNKVAGGAGGHNGLRSIIDHVGNNFPRLRIGIGRPDHEACMPKEARHAMVTRYVLSNFTPSQQDTIAITLTQQAEQMITQWQSATPKQNTPSIASPMASSAYTQGI